MNIYDKAHELASAIKTSEEFKEFKDLHKEVMANEKNKEMVEDFRKKVIEYQVQNYGKEEQDQEELNKIQQLQNALMMNQDIAKYMMAEMRFSQIYDDINKILIEAIKVD
ncbi:MAG: YlbF family regulator [Tissierellia bacterium]|nr:YlbF family regulator [Tissierellia bacterium]